MFIMKKFLLALVALVLPAVASAQYVAGGPTLFDVTDTGFRIINAVPRMLIAVAVIIFMYNLVQYLLKKGSDAKAAGDALKIAGWSIVVIFIMLAWMAGVALLSSTTGLGIGGQLDPELIPSVELQNPLYQ